MAGSVTTAIPNTALAEFLSGGHCFLPPQAGVATTATSTVNVTLGAATAGLAVGMAVTGTNVPANDTIATISPSSATTLTLSEATTGAAASMTFTGDVFKILLLGSTLAGNIAYGTLTTNVGTPGSGTPSQANVGTDEATGTGYTSGGLSLTNAALVQTNPVNSATVDFSTTIQWTGATLSVAGAIIYNTSTRLTAAAAPQNNRPVGVYSFGGTQSVTSGTLTLTKPTADGHTGLIRLSPN